jgi:ribosome-associated translation inhibitor RaiA
MKIDITMQQTHVDDTISRQIAKRARRALNRFSTSIQTLKICVSDTNGPKGGKDTRCVVSAKLASGGEIVVQGENENIFSVLNHCLSRTDRAVKRYLERRRSTPIRMNRRKPVDYDSLLEI